MKPDGIFLSNGPGDPAAVGYAVEAARELCASKLPGVRDLPRPPDPGARARRQDLQAQVRPPRRQPAGDGSRHPQGGDHLAEPRLRRRRRLDGRQGGALARQPQRQDRRGDAARDAAGVQRAVPPRGVARAQRRRVSVRSLPRRRWKSAAAAEHDLRAARSTDERYSENEHRLEAMRAREEYFDRAGKVFDDDAELFEGRMASFLEWYVLERPSAGLGGRQGPISHAVETAAKLPAAERRALAHLASSHRSLFQLASAAEPRAGDRRSHRRRALLGARAPQHRRHRRRGRVRGARDLGR